MNPNRNGKIARLPKVIREKLNQRLEQAVLAAEFAGKPIREQCLSDWRQHGYQRWLWCQPTISKKSGAVSGCARAFNDRQFPLSRFPAFRFNSLL